MMRIMKAKFNYYEQKGFQLVELPYSGEQVSMLVLVPNEGFDEKMNGVEFGQWKKKMRRMDVKVQLPRFTFEWGKEMNEILEKIGIREIFSMNADLSGIDGQRDLYVSKVIQKTFIEVNEEGTEAAAATAVVANRKSAAPSELKVITANHPFIIFIIDNQSEEILFMGKVTDPGQAKSNFEVHLTENKNEMKGKSNASLMSCFRMVVIGCFLMVFWMSF